jgi:predicted acetyltransferase
VNVLSGFFIVRGVRRTGLGLRTAKQLIDRYPGPWEVALQAENTIAVHFWLAWQKK